MLSLSLCVRHRAQRRQGINTLTTGPASEKSLSPAGRDDWHYALIPFWLINRYVAAAGCTVWPRCYRAFEALGPRLPKDRTNRVQTRGQQEDPAGAQKPGSLPTTGSVGRGGVMVSLLKRLGAEEGQGGRFQKSEMGSVCQAK